MKNYIIVTLAFLTGFCFCFMFCFFVLFFFFQSHDVNTLNVLSNRNFNISFKNLVSTNIHDLHNQLQPIGWALAAIWIGNLTDLSFNSRWTSQVGQDKTIVKLFHEMRNGFFIDLAANDAVEFSNTLTLEQEFGWNGLCIEANPQYFRKLISRRCLVIQAAVGQIENSLVPFVFDGGNGGVVGTDFDNSGTFHEMLPSVSVNTIFKQMLVPKIIHYLSLDIEGAEDWCFENFPWNEYTFLAITIERPKEKLVEMLQANNYIFVCDHGQFGDQLWLHKSFPNLTEEIKNLNIWKGMGRETRKSTTMSVINRCS